MEGGDNMQETEMLTSREVARLLRMKPENLALKARIGEIPGVKIGRAWLFRRDTIDRLLAGTPPTPELSAPVG
jgi:excisionase family DNA binding protein